MLPDPGPDAIWGLYDSGSSIDAANRSAHFPGSNLKEAKETGAVYQTATGDPFYNMGEFDVCFKTDGGLTENVSFNNTNVSMPILSVNKHNRRGYRSMLDEDDGYIEHKATGKREPLLCRAGVYFLKLHVHRRLLQQPEGFVRPGAA